MTTNLETNRARLIASESAILLPALRSASKFLIRARNNCGTWGLYPGMPMDLLSSADAIQALEACAQPEFERAIEDAKSPLREYIRHRAEAFDLAESAAALRIHTRRGRPDDPGGSAGPIVFEIESLHKGSGWGEPYPTIPATADVLAALTPFLQFARSSIESATRFLLTWQNRDGGWPILPGGSKSSPLATARASIALAAVNPHRDPQIEKATLTQLERAGLYLRGSLEAGWAPFLTATSGVYPAAQILRAAAKLKTLPYEIVAQGIEAILERSNADGAWGEKKGGNSGVEATSACLTALCAAGANRFVPAALALSMLADAGAAPEQDRFGKLAARVRKLFQKDSRRRS